MPKWGFLRGICLGALAALKPVTSRMFQAGNVHDPDTIVTTDAWVARSIEDDLKLVEGMRLHSGNPAEWLF